MTVSPEKTQEIIVAAVAGNGVIGSQGSLPWHSPEDLRLFRARTLGGTVIMGRRTYQSIGHPLSGRRNIVVSSTLPAAPGIVIVPTFDAAVTAALTFLSPIYYCGGPQIYARALERAETIYLSRMKAAAVGDVFFPKIDLLRWQLVQQEDFTDFVLITYRRNSEISAT